MPTSEPAPLRKNPQEEPNPAQGRSQLIGFSVFLDHQLNEQREQIWQTRIYHHESGEEKIIPGLDMTSWANWILERAQLPVTGIPIPTKAEVVAQPIPEGSYDVRIEILKVRVFEVEAPVGVLKPQRQLVSEISFRITGAAIEAIAQDHIPFQISVYTLNLNSKTLNLVASEQGQLQTHEFEYVSQQEFPFPELGRYEFHSVVFLLPPYERMDYYKSPTLTVVP